MARCALGLAAMLLAAPGGWAHEGLDQQIANLSKQLEDQPSDAELLARRGDLHRMLGEWEQAFADLRAAARLAPGQGATERSLAQLLSDVGWHEAALAVVDRFLADHPDDARGRKLRAQTLQALGQLDSAAVEHDERLALVDVGRPDDYFARADLHLERGDVDRALAGLDEGLAALGSVPSLLLKALDIEVEHGRFDAALARLDVLAAAAQRQETWLSRRGDILLRAERPDEARAAYAQARAALQRLRPRHRSTAAMVDLERHIADQLALLDRPDATPDASHLGSKTP